MILTEILFNNTKFWTQIIITIFAVFILLNIWWAYYINRLNKFSIDTRDYGVILLALGMIVWSLISMLKLAQPIKQEDNLAFMGLIKFLSILNNTLFLFAITYFDHGIDWVKKPEHRRKTFVVIGTTSLITYSIIAYTISRDEMMLSKILSSGYSILTLIILMGVLFESFSIRKLYGLSFISIAVISAVLLGQLFTTFEEEIGFINKTLSDVIYLSSHSILISIFVALTFSWIIEKSTIVPYNQELFQDLKNQREAKEIVERYKDNPEKVVQLIKHKISMNQTEIALRILMEWYSEKGEKENLKTTILRLSEYNQIELQKNRGTISQDEAAGKEKEIKETILDLIEKFEMNNNT